MYPAVSINLVDEVFSLLDVWQKLNTDPVCYGARDNKYGAFNITKTGRVRTMKLVHKSGSILCNTRYGDSFWGCINPVAYSTKQFMTIMANSKGEALLPPIKTLEGRTCGKKHYYGLEETGHKSTVLVYRNLSSLLPLARGQELQIWYGQDWIDCSEDNNSGATCVDVYAWYI